jgi:hypothetical protein
VRGTVVIDGQSFKLENGPVYLVDLRSGAPVVEQLAVAPELLQAGSDAQRLRADARIARFFERTESPR